MCRFNEYRIVLMLNEGVKNNLQNKKWHNLKLRIVFRFSNLLFVERKFIKWYVMSHIRIVAILFDCLVIFTISTSYVWC